MRNGGCVPGHSISAAFHQSRGRGAPLLVSVFSICTSSRTNNWQAAYRLTHTITFTHTRAFALTCGRANVHKHTGQQLITCIFKWLNAHKHTHIHTVTHQYGTSTPLHHKHLTTHSSCSPLGDIHNFLIIIFLWSLQAFFHF